MIQALRRHARWMAAAAATLIAVAACGGSSTSNGGGQTSFKGQKTFGLSIALTGQSQLYGHAISQSLKLALNDVNAKGGINGYQMVPDILDDATQVSNAVDNVKKLILQDNAVAMLGQVTSAQCQATSPISKQNKILFIASTCNSYQLTTEPDLINPYYVSVVPNTYMEGTAAGNLAAKTNAKKIFIVSPNYLFGRSETNAFVAQLKKVAPSAQIINPQSTWYVPFPTNPDWHSTINAIQADKPDLVYSNIFAADQINFIKQALQVDPNFFKTYPMTTLASVDDLNALQAQYPVNMHLYMRAPFFALNNSAMNSFVSHYKATYNEYPSDWAVMAYDAIQMYATAANAAKSFDSDKVLKQIVGHSFPTLRGYSFKIRSGDQQANVGESVGTTADSGGKYPFPTLTGGTNLKGDDLIMPTKLMDELRSGQCEKGGSPTTTDFANCPSWNG